MVYSGPNPVIGCRPASLIIDDGEPGVPQRQTIKGRDAARVRVRVVVGSARLPEWYVWVP